MFCAILSMYTKIARVTHSGNAVDVILQETKSQTNAAGMQYSRMVAFMFCLYMISRNLVSIFFNINNDLL